MSPVGSAWRAVVSWCRDHAPVTAAALPAPASAPALSAAQEATGQAWPDELLEWLSLNDGGGRPPEAFPIPPRYVALSAARIAGEWKRMTGLAAELATAAELAAAEAEPAASHSGAFLRPWIPIATDFAASLLFIDLRPGPRHGCVCQWEDGAGLTRRPLWDDLTTLLVAIGQALKLGRWHRDDLVRRVDDGVLAWDDNTGWEVISAPEPPGSDEELAGLMASAAEKRRLDRELYGRSGGPS